MFKNSSEIKLSVAKFCPLKKSKSVVVLLHSGGMSELSNLYIPGKLAPFQYDSSSGAIFSR